MNQHKQKINTLCELELEIKKELTQNIMLNREKLHNIMNRYSGCDWEKYVYISSVNYNKEKICENELFDMFIITWNHYQCSAIHDHSKNGCLYKVLDGNITEKIYNSNDTLNVKIERNMLNGEVSYIDNSIGYHSMNNLNENICVTLHVYSPPNYITNYY